MADKFSYIYEDPTAVLQVTGSTPYGIYDSDSEFQTDSLNVCKFVARRLGHPIMQLEFNSGSIYATFEEAVSEYSTQINHYNMKNWMWEHYGSSNKQSGSTYSSTGSAEVVTPHMGTTFMLSEQYGEAVNVGDRLEIQRVFNYGPAAITRFYDPFAGSFEQRQMLDAFGMGNVAPAVSFILRPISYDIARAQAIETNDKVRKSNYTFELQNNRLRVFPIPKNVDSGSDKLYFQYYLKDDKEVTGRDYTNNKVTDPSNAPYKFINYSEINSTGRQWIRKYSLALSKELLGIIRSKYASMPLPNGEVSLDGEALKAEGREEKVQLLDELKEFLDSVTLRERSAAEQEQAESQQAVLNKAPLGIFIG